MESTHLQRPRPHLDGWIGHCRVLPDVPERPKSTAPPHNRRRGCVSNQQSTLPPNGTGPHLDHDVWRNDKGVTTASKHLHGTTEMALSHRDIVMPAASTAEKAVMDVCSVSNGSWLPRFGPVFGRRFGLVWFQTGPQTRPALSWRVCYPDRT